MKQIISVLFAALILASCGSTKAVQGEGKGTAPATGGKQKDSNGIDFLRQVSDNAVYSKDIVSSIDFSLTAMGRDISVSGKLQMRKNEMIRIMLTPFSLMEAGRIEFAPDYVLVVDRINKQYVKATYNDVDFLKNNGMDFYTLQALFWNELFVPSKKAVAESDFSAFTVGPTERGSRAVALKTGSLDFRWTVDAERKQIRGTEIAYRKGTAQESTMSFSYDDFVPVGARKFPSKEVLTFNSNAAGTGRIVLSIAMNRISSDSNWDAKTTVSSRYTQVPAQEVLSKLMGQ